MTTKTYVSGATASTAVWSPVGAPTTGDDVVINSTANAISWDITAVLNSFLLNTGYSGTVTQNSNINTASFTMNAGTFTGNISYTFTCSGNFTWTAGTITGAVLVLYMSATASLTYPTTYANRLKKLKWAGNVNLVNAIYMEELEGVSGTLSGAAINGIYYIDNVVSAPVPVTVSCSYVNFMINGGFSSYNAVNYTFNTVYISVINVADNGVYNCNFNTAFNATSFTIFDQNAVTNLQFTCTFKSSLSCTSLTIVDAPISTRHYLVDVYGQTVQLGTVSVGAYDTLSSSVAGAKITASGGITIAANGTLDATNISTMTTISCGGAGTFTGSGTTALIIPDGTLTVGYLAFSGMHIFSSILVPGSVTELIAAAFYACAHVTSVIIEKGVTAIGTESFYGCSLLSSITFKGLVAPVASILTGGWVGGCAAGIRGHAYQNSDFPITGNSFYGLIMGTYLQPPLRILSTEIQVGEIVESSVATKTSLDSTGILTTMEINEMQLPPTYTRIPVNFTVDGAQTNYPMKLTIYSGVGTNSAGVVYLNNWALKWPYDIVFKNAGGTSLDYWRESYDATSQVVWVELDSIASSGTTDFYLYYGDSTLEDRSSGANTFLFFDDFNTSSISNWTRSEGAVTATTSASIFSINGNTAWTKYYTASYSVPATGAIRYKSRQSTTGQAVGVEPVPCCVDRRLSYQTGYLVTAMGGASDNVSGYWSYTTWYIFDEMRVSNGTTKFYLNNVLSFTSSGTGTNAVPLSIGSITGLVEVDWILSRKYTGNEPTWATPVETFVETCTKLTVNHTDDGVQTNYPMKLTIYYGIGTNSAGIVYLNGASLNWPYDIVFKNSSGTILDYWRESYNTTSQVVWVELDNIALTGTTDFYLYYGNKNQVDLSNGTNTFSIFDDFLGASLDGAKWSNASGGATVASSILTVTGAGKNVLSLTQFGQGYAIRTLAKIPIVTYNYLGFSTNSIGEYANIQGYASSHQIFYSGVNGGAFTPDFSGTDYLIFNLKKLVGTTNNLIFNVEGLAVPTNGTKSYTYTGEDQSVLVRSDPATIYVDWVLVRKCTVNEPTWATPVTDSKGRHPVFRLHKPYLIKLPISPSLDGSLTNYQMKLTIYSGVGSNSMGICYLNGKSLNWPYDIKIENESGVTLDYWRESFDSTSQVIWIECDSISASVVTNLYLSYSYETQRDLSNGNNTFPLFDDFTGQTLDSTKWDDLGGGGLGITVGGGKLQVDFPVSTTGSRGIRSKATFLNNYVHVAIGTTYLSAPGASPQTYVGFNISTPSEYQLVYLRGWISPYHNCRTYPADTATSLVTYNSYAGNHRWEVYRNGIVSTIFKIDGATVATHYTLYNTIPMSATLNTYSGASVAVTSQLQIDKTFVRKYTTNEPYFGVPLNMDRIIAISAKYITEV